MGLKVFKSCCKNCLLSEDRIVSPKRAKNLIKDTIKNGTYFICHKATMEGNEEIVCSKFFNELGDKSQLIKIAKRLDAIEFIEQKDSDKLITFKEINQK